MRSLVFILEKRRGTYRPERQAATLKCVSGNAPSCLTYPVQQGDTFNSIATAFGIFPQALAAANKDVVSDPTALLRVGLSLKLPPWDNAVCGAAPKQGA